MHMNIIERCEYNTIKYNIIEKAVRTQLNKNKTTHVFVTSNQSIAVFKELPNNEIVVR